MQLRATSFPNSSQAAKRPTTMAEGEVPGPEQPLGNDFAVMTKRASVIILSRPAGVDVGLDLNPPGFGLMAQLKFVEDHCVRNETAFPTDQ